MPVRGLVAACHPLPCLAVTGFAGGWAAAIGLPASRLVLVMTAVLLGQLSVGWSNDWVDAGRDRAAGRRDKPIAGGLVTRRSVGLAAAVAALACVVVSFTLGPRPGTVHVVAVASAWSYNLALKFTPLSPLPYAVSFGLLPAVVTWASTGPGWPAVGVMVGAALLGVAAHFANTVPDAEADAATGVRGLPQRWGPRRSLQVMAGSVAVAALALLSARDTAGTGPQWLRWGAPVALGGGAVLAVAVALAGERTGSRAFRLTLVAVGLVIAGFLMSASRR